MIPSDPIMLLSYINTQLRDNYSSFEDFIEDKDEDADAITDMLDEAGYVYNESNNQFVRKL